MNQVYLDTARLLTQVAPFVFADGAFALKGGTAINMFIRDLPRLSVDLDLVFIDHSLPRDIALECINEAIRQSADRLNARGIQTRTSMMADTGETKLLVRRGGIEVKIEVTRDARYRSSSSPGHFDIQSARGAAGRPGYPGCIVGGHVWRQVGRSHGPAASPRPVRRDAALRT
jgi:hypothetical protein